MKKSTGFFRVVQSVFKKRYILLPGLFSIVLISFFSCKQPGPDEREIEKIEMAVSIDRFDLAFAKASEADLPELKKRYPAFFPKQYDDSIWLEKMNDTLQIELEEEVRKAFPDNTGLESVLEPLFKRIKYYFPDFEPPVVVTTTSDVDYYNKVILADSILVVALDNFLGSDHRFYEGIVQYNSKVMKPSQIGPEVAAAFSRRYVAPPRSRTFLELIVYHGKQLYLKDLWLPGLSDAEKIGYTEKEYQWAEENEVYMWQYFIENEILYSTDPRLEARFVNPAPFSKFYLEIDNESPGMLGKYLGWKIVKSYMKNNSVSLRDLMQIDGETLFKNSKFKPKK